MLKVGIFTHEGNSLNSVVLTCSKYLGLSGMIRSPNREKMIGTVHMSMNTLQLPKTYPEVKLNWISVFKRSRDILITEVIRIHRGHFDIPRKY